MPQDSAEILVFENEPLLAEIICFHLQLLGHRPTWKESRQEAAEWLSDHSIDLLLLDIAGHDLQEEASLGNDLPDRTFGDVPLLLLEPAPATLSRRFTSWPGPIDRLLLPFDPLALEQKTASLLGQRFQPVQTV